jgi:hypothetical protein
MAHSELELVRDRHKELQAAAALHHEARRVLTHGRAKRQAERAERKTLSHAQAARQLRAKIAELETGY